MARKKFAIRERSASEELHEIIAECVAATDNFDDAASRLLSRVKGDPAIYAALMQGHERAAAMDAVRMKTAIQRRAIWHAPAPVMPNGSPANDRVAALVRGNTTMLMEFRLPGGLPVAKATAADLKEAASFYLERASDMAGKGHWLARIAAALPEGATVAEKFGEADLARFRQEVGQC